MIQLFFNIIETTLEFSIIIAILFMAMHLIGKKFTAKCRYIIWALIFIRLAIPFGPFSGMAFFTLELPITESSITQNTIFSSNNNWDSIVSNNSTPNVINTTDNLDKANAQPNQQAIVNSNVANGINISNDSSSSTLTNSSQSTGFFEIYGAFILSILILIWAAVAIVYFLWHLTIYLLYTAMVKKSLIPADQTTYDILSQLCAQEKITRIPKIYISMTIGSPMLFGFFHSTIAIPENLKNNHSLAGIITHELIHYKRKDLWLKLITMFAESVHWFNPLIHAAARKFEAEMELSCDEHVLKNYNAQERASYGNAMLDIVKRCHSKYTVLTTHFNPKKSSIKERFINILDNTKKRSGKSIIILMILVCVLAGTLIACGTVKSTVTNVDSTTNTETETLPAVSTPKESEIKYNELFTTTGTAKVLYIYTSNEKNFIYAYSDKFSREEYRYVGSYQCTTSDATCQDGYGSKILVHDGGFFIYDYITGISKEVIFSNVDVQWCSFVHDTDIQEPLGIIVNSLSSDGDAGYHYTISAFYNLKKQCFITDFTKSIYEQYSVRNYLFCRNNVETSILDIDTGKVLFSIKSDNIQLCSGQIRCLSNENGFYIIVNNSDVLKGGSDVYNDEFKLLLMGKIHIPDKMDAYYSVMLNDNGNVTVITPDGLTYKTYNKKGELVSTGQTYKQVYGLAKNCAYVVDKDNYLKVINMTTGAELVKLVEWSDKMKVINLSFTEYSINNRPVGMHIYTNDSSDENQRTIYYYTPDTGENGVIQYNSDPSTP